jgi:hypothetical protein
MTIERVGQPRNGRFLALAPPKWSGNFKAKVVLRDG